MVLVLDSAAFSELARGSSAGNRTVRAALRAAAETGAQVVVLAAVIAEQYRGGANDQVVDSYLGRETGIAVVNTDRHLARQIGNLSARPGRSFKDHVDATVVAAAVSKGGGVILTGDPVTGPHWPMAWWGSASKQFCSLLRLDDPQWPDGTFAHNC